MNKPYAIGLDLGGTNSVFGIVDNEGNIIETASMKTGGYTEAKDYFNAAFDTLTPIIEKVGGLDSIEMAPNLPWAHETSVPLAKMFSERLGGMSVHITNDANAAALGEMTYGVARGMKNFIVLTLGTGVGSGIVINGQMVYGCDGMAGELGHVIMRRDGRQCGCGRRGCLEAYCSATGVARTAREWLTATDRPSLLREIPMDKITSLDVCIAAGKGDAMANEIFQFTGEMLGEACANFAAFSSPEAFIFFGGMTKAGDLIMKPIEETYRAKVMPVFRDKPQFLVSSLDGAGAAVLGAAAIQ